ncbi:hypothetical protein L5157_004680 [Vibrio parahaemolyticus]|uniref:hypothetical protein n=1 Tax=Vibrio parahaemolyticus TaxID=670 RepID=UPI0005F0D165|nr:hypothetical protein [Vibrio parahaemolyticus]EIU6823050.1 hypothetical protein [Vibrio parahaemolyticus]ELI5395484.1 hypothetical protein [Vibrio parahaemolyticus]MBM5068890.1 hypothetical protein [Vibrio parahaemolyticus]MDG2647044.1 hypothetical protein [Vibrio parahaemolyticus]MDG3394026.1 hypothetical protein [Vibrio parahaemolyticus]
MDNSNFVSLIIGIASSLLATGLFISISEFARRVVIPWCQDKLYNGVRVEGDWLHDVEKSKYDVYAKMSLTQWGASVKGNYHHGEGKDQEHYKVSGTVSNQFLLLNFTPETNKCMDVGVALFHIDESESHGRLELKGNMLYKDGSSSIGTLDTLVFELHS